MIAPQRRDGLSWDGRARHGNSSRLPTATGGAAFDLSPAGLRGWASSLLLHALLLLAMGLWYFTPPTTPDRTIETRLFGSESGIEDGVGETGGLNTPLDLRGMDEAQPDPALEFAPSVEFAPTRRVKKPRPQAALTPTRGGGLESDNPGAGDGDGFGAAKFGDGGESIRGVAVKVGDPQFTLLWDSEADLDLHVVEPGGTEINWEHPVGSQGGELDVDNSKGFGPENIYWLSEDPSTGAKVKGTGPPGTYRWFVMFWGGLDGKVKPTNWKVRVKHAGKVEFFTGHFRVLNDRSKERTLRVAGPGGTEVLPSDKAKTREGGVDPPGSTPPPR